MDADSALARVKGMIAEKERGYFLSHGLVGLLKDAGMDSGPGQVVALARRLIEDDVHAFLAAASAGLRDAASDDDESARAISAAARRMRHDAFHGPLVDALVEIGKARLGPAVGLSNRLVELGDADFAAYLIGGAYGGARSACDGMIERLLSSDDPAWAATAVQSIRVARTEHGAPSAEYARAAARRALALGGAAVAREAMETMLDSYERGDAAAGGMIESMAAEHPASRPVLASRIWCRSPFDDEQGLRYLETCTNGSPGQHTVYSAYCALAGIAGREPRGATRLLLRLFAGGRYHAALAGMVLEELGRSDAPGTIAAILDMLQTRHREALEPRLTQIVRRVMRHGDYKEVAGRVLRSAGERPAALGDCLSVLGILVAEGRKADREGPDAHVMSGLRGHAAGAGEAGRGPPAAAQAPSVPA